MKDWLKILSSGCFGALLVYIISSGFFSSDTLTIQMSRSTFLILLIFAIYVFRVEIKLSQLKNMLKEKDKNNK